MEWLWTWGGTSFGYKVEDKLRTHDGRHVGRFFEDEVYDKNGRYLGELKNGRLITNTSKKSKRKSGFIPSCDTTGYVNKVDYVGTVMYVGYEDFPKPESIK